MNFFLGCAVWAYKDWVGHFYPAKTPQKDFLRLYAERLTAVEGNTTFYAIPEEKTVAKWTLQTPPTFRFCLKFPREITHNGLLQPAVPQALSFLQIISNLGDRLGPTFAQLPPRYGPEYMDDLAEFLTALPRQRLPIAVEFRHPDWFIDPYWHQANVMLQRLGVAKVLLDTRAVYSTTDDPQQNSPTRKPKLPVIPETTNNSTIVRFISHPHRSDINRTYLQEWVGYIENWLQEGKRVYFFVHCPEEIHSPGIAWEFQQILEQRGVSVPSLPPQQQSLPPQQLNLF